MLVASGGVNARAPVRSFSSSFPSSSNPLYVPEQPRPQPSEGLCVADQVEAVPRPLPPPIVNGLSCLPKTLFTQNSACVPFGGIGRFLPESALFPNRGAIAAKEPARLIAAQVIWPGARTRSSTGSGSGSGSGLKFCMMRGNHFPEQIARSQKFSVTTLNCRIPPIESRDVTHNKVLTRNVLFATGQYSAGAEIRYLSGAPSPLEEPIRRPRNCPARPTASAAPRTSARLTLARRV